LILGHFHHATKITFIENKAHIKLQTIHQTTKTKIRAKSKKAQQNIKAADT
jgi:hypothetical protein